MFWILRRTGAANFFNSLNNNCATSKAHGTNAQLTQDKYVKRPPRKAYGRLSVDSDDASSAKHITDDPFEDINNFAMISSANCTGKNKNKSKQTKANKTNEISREKLQNGGLCHSNSHPNEGDRGGGGSGSGCSGIDFSGNDSGCSGLNCCNGDLTNSCIDDGDHCKEADCQGNYSDNNLCQYNTNNVCNGATTLATTCNGNFKEPSSLCQLYNSKEINENTINRLQAMAMSDDDDYDEALTCNVCDRAFHCHRQLASHQQKKRHFGCGGCDSLFPSLMLLEHHKEEFEHWSDDEVNRRVCCRRNRGDDYFTDTDSFTSEAESEDLERLL